MMTDAARKIHTQLSTLRQYKKRLEKELQALQDSAVRLKREMHRLELDLITGRHIPNDSLGTTLVYQHVKKLANQRQILRKDSQKLKETTRRLQDLSKRVSNFEFWEKYADTDNSIKQQTALRHVFG